MKEWDGNISRLKPYLVALEARLAAVEGRLADPKESKADKSPDPQKVAAEALAADKGKRGA